MKKLHLAVVLHSVALIAFQLALMQILSIVQWYHFAYMVISVALLGFGAGGALLAIARSSLMKRADMLIPALMILTGGAMAAVVGLSQTDLVRFDSYLVFVDISHVASLILTYLLLAVPFFLGALALGMIFVKHVGHIGSLYFANMTGSGLGGVAALIAMWVVMPEQLPALFSFLPIVAGLLLKPPVPNAGFPLAGVALLVLSLLLFLIPPSLSLSEYKSLSRSMNLPDAEISLERSSPYGLVHVLSSPVLRYGPGLSLAYQSRIPVREAVFNNGDWYGPIVSWTRDDSTHLLDFTTVGAPFAMSQPKRVLVLGAGTGMNVAQALTKRIDRVIAVEPHRSAISVITNEFAQQTDYLFSHHAVEVRSVDPRTFLFTDTSYFDLIVVPMLDAFGGTSGLYALQEQYYLTRESFRMMWDRLTPQGMISLSSWMDYPVRNPLKACASIVEAMEDAGVADPARHLAAVRSWGTITFVAKKTPLSGEEISRLRSFCNTMLFDPALLPHLNDDERARFNVLGDVSFFDNLDKILSHQRDDLYVDYPFHIKPATDDRPYFSQFLKLQHLRQLSTFFGQQSVPFLELGYLVVLLTFVQILLAAACLISAPVLFQKRLGRWRTWTLLYFSGLGIGYMFVEIVLIQRFILFLGLPIFAAAAVITALLISSGFGSLASARLEPTPYVLWRIGAVISALILIYAFLLTDMLYAAISLSLPVKALLSVILIFPPGFLMGMMFPLGLRLVSRRHDTHVAWAWSINGCTSVMSTPLATIIAVEAGFIVVMLCATTTYLLSAVAGRISEKGFITSEV